MKLADTRAIAHILDRPESTIRWWAHKGWLTRHGTTKRALYDIDEAQELDTLLKLDNHPDQPQH